MLWTLLATLSLLFGTPTQAKATVSAGGSPTHVASGTDTNYAPDAVFNLSWGSTIVPLRVMAVFALPGEDVPIYVRSQVHGFQVAADGGVLSPRGENAWSWRAPFEPGLVPMRVTSPAGDQVLLNVFVLVPYDRMKHGDLEGQEIGDYPATMLGGKPEYARPRGFIRMTKELENAPVSPHFHLGQFACKDQKRYPKFLVLQPALLVKLEKLLDIAHQNGFQATTFHVMSAYRTPRYNKGIGNKTTYSRHQYGDAADIFLDEFPADGVMDDLNHDGRLTEADAQVLRGWADSIDRDPASTLTGGLSAYGSTESHGPFVHVDTRGSAARW